MEQYDVVYIGGSNFFSVDPVKYFKVTVRVTEQFFPVVIFFYALQEVSHFYVREWNSEVLWFSRYLLSSAFLMLRETEKSQISSWRS